MTKKKSKKIKITIKVKIIAKIFAYFKEFL